MSFYLKKYMWLISMVAVVFCSYFLARATSNFIAMQFDGGVGPSLATPARVEVTLEPRQAPAEDKFEPIVDRNIFDSKYVKSDATASASPTEPVAEEPIDPNAEAVATTLSVKLVSTFAVGDGRDPRSTAIISGGAGKGAQDVYTVGDEKQFAPDTKIVKILHSRVEFTNKGRLEYVELEDFAKGASLNVPPRADEQPGEPTAKEEPGAEPPKIAQEGEGKYVIDRAEIDAALANLDKLYTQIRAVPHFKEGRPNGLKLLSVRADSLFSKLGLRRGDILQKINGMELDIKKGLDIFNKLKSESSITMEVERRGAAQTLEYEIR